MKVLLAVLVAAQATPPAADSLEHKVYPPRPLLERTRLGQAMNFDVELTNTSASTLELTAIRAAVRGPGGRIVQRLEVNDNGISPSIWTVPDRTWKAGEAHTVFNPFHTLAADMPLGRVDYEFVFRDEKKGLVVEEVQVRPAAYRQKTSLVLPLPGRVLVWDGHDFYSHHRRWDFSHPVARRLGLLTNPARYSFDLVIADADGRFHKPDPSRREDYFSFAAPVVAPGDGTIVALANDAPNEPAEPSPAAFERDPMFAIYGNYVVIDHGNGEFSQLGHLKQGSVRVAVGDRVKRGQEIAEAGASGTSLFPHLHYQLTTRPGVDGEGLPARFDNLVRVMGAATRPEPDGWIDTGDIVESAHGR